MVRFTPFPHREPANEIVFDVSNGILLKPDLKHALNHQRLVFYPKDQHFVSHFMREDTPHEAQAYHNVPVHIGNGVSIHFIFGNFAFNLISSARKQCDNYAKRKEWHTFMLTNPKPYPSKASSNTSSAECSSNRSAFRAGMQDRRSADSQAELNDPELVMDDSDKMATLASILSGSTWDFLSSSGSSEFGYEYQESGSSQGSGDYQIVVPACAYTQSLYPLAYRSLSR